MIAISDPPKAVSKQTRPFHARNASVTTKPEHTLVVLWRPCGEPSRAVHKERAAPHFIAGVHNCIEEVSTSFELRGKERRLDTLHAALVERRATIQNDEVVLNVRVDGETVLDLHTDNRTVVDTHTRERTATDVHVHDRTFVDPQIYDRAAVKVHPEGKTVVDTRIYSRAVTDVRVDDKTVVNIHIGNKTVVDTYKHERTMLDIRTQDCMVIDTQTDKQTLYSTCIDDKTVYTTGEEKTSYTRAEEKMPYRHVEHLPYKLIETKAERLPVRGPDDPARGYDASDPPQTKSSVLWL